MAQAFREALLTAAEVKLLNRIVTSRAATTCSESLLESAVNLPLELRTKHYLTDRIHLAAALAHCMVKTRVFGAANKRTALLTAEVFLRNSGYRFEPEPSVAMQSTLASCHAGVETGKVSEMQLAECYSDLVRTNHEGLRAAVLVRAPVEPLGVEDVSIGFYRKGETKTSGAEIHNYPSPHLIFPRAVADRLMATGKTPLEKPKVTTYDLENQLLILSQGKNIKLSGDVINSLRMVTPELTTFVFTGDCAIACKGTLAYAMYRRSYSFATTYRHTFEELTYVGQGSVKTPLDNGVLGDVSR